MAFLTPTWSKNGVDLYLGDCREILPTLDAVDHVITDPPFSEVTHKGHNVVSANENGILYDGVARNKLHYESWADVDATEFINQISPICSAWMVIFNDDVLAPAIRNAMDKCGRYAFAPLPFYAPGSRVRLSGDGPSSWTIWIMVSRTKAQSRWGTLPGGYLAQEGWRDREYMGGKPVKLMEAIVGDYSRKGDLILDPYMGSGTTGVAAVKLQRRFIGIEINPESFEIAVRRIESAMNETALLDWAQAEQERLPI